MKVYTKKTISRITAVLFDPPTDLMPEASYSLSVQTQLLLSLNLVNSCILDTSQTFSEIE